MKKIRIGILTLFYNNINYGAILQAYALSKKITEMGFECEQVNVSRIFHKEGNKSLKKYLKPQNYIVKFNLIVTLTIRNIREKPYLDLFQKRKSRIEEFKKIVPQTDIVYNDDTIHQVADKYDLFVVGSDQVWGITQFTSPYLLNFLPDEKPRISYAASMGYSKLDDANIEIYKSTLNKYREVSVREEDAVYMLTPLTRKRVIQTLDPTLLLDCNEWDMLCKPMLIKKKYLLCYFLGNDKKLREVAKEYASKHGLLIATYPHYPNEYHSFDRGFGDIQLEDATPDEFLSHIKYADAIFTDSFHASVFSLLYEKQFFVFNRVGQERMSSRLYSLMALFDTEDRFITNRDMFNIAYLESLKPVNYDNKRNKFDEMKDSSIDFLKRNLY